MKILTCLTILSALPLAAQTDAFGYTMTNAVGYAYNDIAATGSSALASADDDQVTVALPFAFRFYGTIYSSVCISSNGVLSFGSCPANDFTNLDLSAQSPTGNQPLIAPLWSDLTFSPAGAGSVAYETQGISGSRQFIIQWNNVFALNSPGAFNFQTILSEGSNQILFQYRKITSSAPAVSGGAAATVGIRGPGAPANQYLLQWSFKAGVLADSSALKFTAPVTISAVEVTNLVRVTTSPFSYNRLTRIYSGTIQVQNTSAQPINWPLTVLLANLTAGVSAINPSGTLAGQGPYLSVPGSGSLAPGQSVTVPVQFSNPANASIVFIPKVYSGNF